jgi:hypothetical protein
LKVSEFFARHRVRSLLCQVRSLTSLPSVYPATKSSARSSGTFFAARPITATSSPSNSIGPGASAGITICSPFAISAFGDR